MGRIGPAQQRFEVLAVPDPGVDGLIERWRETAAHEPARPHPDLARDGRSAETDR